MIQYFECENNCFKFIFYVNYLVGKLKKMTTTYTSIVFRLFKKTPLTICLKRNAGVKIESENVDPFSKMHSLFS